MQTELSVDFQCVYVESPTDSASCVSWLRVGGAAVCPCTITTNDKNTLTSFSGVHFSTKYFYIVYIGHLFA